jgi:hypothetical protein
MKSSRDSLKRGANAREAMMRVNGLRKEKMMRREKTTSKVETMMIWSMVKTN